MCSHTASASLWMCSGSGPLECNDSKFYIGEVKGLEEDITCTHKNGKGEER